jgi:GNAT superfamily N-acetyltransferase
MTIAYRPLEPADNRATSEILAAAIDDLSARKGVQGNSTAGLDPDEAWERRRTLWEHLAETAERGWLAERDGRPIGYARTILRDGLRELTEFFVLPDAQNGGVGRELLTRAFPPGEGAANRCLIATSDSRALARYLKAGLAAQFPIYAFARAPEAVEVETDLIAEPIDSAAPDVTALAAVDRAILGHRRDADHRFLARTRAGHLYRRGGEVVAYGYHGPWQGPFAALDPADQPALLGAAESGAAAARLEEVTFEVGLVNHAAVGWLLGRGYRLDPFLTFFMTDRAFGQFDRYVLTSPPIFL